MNREGIDNKICCCGTSWRDFLDSGLFGCEKCYETFQTELLPVLSRIQKCTSHYRLDRKEEPKKEKLFQREEDSALDALRLRYRELLRAGNYEDAEKIGAILTRKWEELV